MPISNCLFVTNNPDTAVTVNCSQNFSYKNCRDYSFSELLKECRKAAFHNEPAVLVFSEKFSCRLYELQSSFPQLYFKKINSKIHSEANSLNNSINKKTKDYMLKINQAIKTKIPVLMIGESGSGKNYNARLIHKKSGNPLNNFFELNINEINPNLMETTLFGSVKGAFTGAQFDSMGFFECARNGTLFLDEISYLSRDMQVKLLGVLDKNAFRKVGGTKEIASTARMIFATDSNLRNLVKEKKFIQPLFYRISVLIIRIPPLRERLEELTMLAIDFAREQQKTIAPDALKKLHTHHWPGNIRELKNCIQRSCVQAFENTIHTEDISFDHEFFDFSEP